MPSTIGGAFAKKQVDYVSSYGVFVDFLIWDTAGQEKYRSFSAIYYKDACIAILVYDITKKETFNEIKKYWFPTVKENSPENIQIVICGNKNDLYEYEDVDKEDIKKFCEDNNCMNFVVSAKDGSLIDVNSFIINSF